MVGDVKNVQLRVESAKWFLIRLLSVFGLFWSGRLWSGDNGHGIPITEESVLLLDGLVIYL